MFDYSPNKLKHYNKENDTKTYHQTCLKKIQRYNRKEQIGTYSKKYEKKRQVLKQTGSYQQKSCSKFSKCCLYS